MNGRDCDVSGHRWRKWKRIGVLFQRRTCKDCGREENARIPIAEGGAE